MASPNIHDFNGGERTWPEYRRLVLSELSRIDRHIIDLERRVDIASHKRDIAIRDLELDVGALKVKVIVFGSIAGLIAAGLSQFLVKVLPVI